MTEQADAHLKQIIAQQPSFDLHDGSHSQRVAKNIEAMLGQSGLQGLSVYDLFLLQTASYLHDCAMALPQWEDDSSQFEPVTNLRFSLDQKRILELLMGVKLYKDPFACLRELYQNALDASRKIGGKSIAICDSGWIGK